MIIALSMKKVKNKNKAMTIEDLVILSKALAYSAATVSEKTQRNKMLNRAVQYISAAINIETSKEKLGEYFFYLSQFYEFAQKDQMMFRALNISRKLGFKPAEKLLKSKLRPKVLEPSEKSLIDQFTSNMPYGHFSLTYSPELEDRVGNTWSYVKKQQKQKFSDTGKRLGKFLKEI